MRLSKSGKLANLASPYISYRQHSAQLSRQAFYGLKVARRRLVLGSLFIESELVELDNSKLADSPSLVDISPRVVLEIDKKILKMMNRIEKFEKNYRKQGKWNILKLPYTIIFFTDLSWGAAIEKIMDRKLLKQDKRSS